LHGLEEKRTSLLIEIYRTAVKYVGVSTISYTERGVVFTFLQICLRIWKEKHIFAPQNHQKHDYCEQGTLG
jgi:hypothetical protein